MKTFETHTTGKWILVGEHSVLRGGRALVFPLESAHLHFAFAPNDSGQLELTLNGSTGSDFERLFWSVLDRACQMTGLDRNRFSGQVQVTSEIPVGTGLGASAAFCVAMARWFASFDQIPTDRIESFARELENLFHGESSGVDIAVAHSGSPLAFSRAGERKRLEPQWRPLWYLTYSGHRGITKECVTQVKELWTKDAKAGKKIDDRMAQAVSLAELSLMEPATMGLPQLAKAMQMAGDCFRDWGLFDEESQRVAKRLLSRGALAVKPTGSGGGGFLLSLWAAPPADSEGLILCSLPPN